MVTQANGSHAEATCGSVSAEKKKKKTSTTSDWETVVAMAAGSVSAPLIIPIINLQTQRTKNHINTSTPVSIQSDYEGVLIYFTLDGSKPEAGPRGAGLRGAEGGSRKYSGPILLPAGRVSVRAVAVTRDGRQSSVVTKVFSVDQLEDEQNLQHLSDGTSCPAENSDGSLPSSKEPRTTGRPGPRFLNGRLGSRTTGPGSCRRSQSAELPGAEPLRGAEPLSITEAARVQRDTDFLRCPHCLAARPPDPLARFCAQCGAVVPRLPGQRLPPAEAGQTLLCVFCNSVVPVNINTCLICEEPVEPQRRPQARLALQDHVRCVSCGSGNPAHISSCLTCDRRLQPVSRGDGDAPVAPATRGRTSTCSRCNRRNQNDARFCDWCGAKSARAVNRVACWRCGASGHPYALFCAACGVLLEAPPTSCDDITHPIRDAGASRVSAGSAPFLKVTPPTMDRQTQTVGLYYPSAAELEKKEQQRAPQANRRPPLTAVSPGRGYWRKQLDHVCAHLRSYAQNNAPFRALLGEPRLGRIVSAVIQEDQDEVGLTFSFAATRRDERQSGSDGPVGGGSGPAGGGSGPAGGGSGPAGGGSGPAGGGSGPAGGGSGPAGGGSGPAGGGSGPTNRPETLSTVTERSISSSLRSRQASRGIKPKPESTPAVSDGRLLKELGPGGGRISTVQQLLDQGADPSCCGSDGRHALSIAVGNGHHALLPVLVQRGADVDQRSGPMKNTALHDAAALGAAGLQSAEVLLRCKASVRQRNGGGQTAYDVAVSSGCSDMASLMMAQTGLDLLGRLGRPRLNLDVF